MPAFLFSAPEVRDITARFSELRCKGKSIPNTSKRFKETTFVMQNAGFEQIMSQPVQRDWTAFARFWTPPKQILD